MRSNGLRRNEQNGDRTGLNPDVSVGCGYISRGKALVLSRATRVSLMCHARFALLQSSAIHYFESTQMETPNDPKFNPYQAPAVTAQPDDAGNGVGTYVPGGRTVDAGEGLVWITSAWKLFVAAPMMWIVMIVLYAVFYLVLAFLPVIGSLLGYLLYGVIGAGWLAAAHAVAKGEKLEIDHLFAGFKTRTSPLFVLGACYAGGLIAILVLMATLLAIGLGASGAVGAILSGDSSQLASIAGASIMTFLFAVLVGLALLAPLLIALWFSPALVYFHNEPPLEALKMSFMACLRNWLPFLVYGVLMLILVVIAAIPLMLGFLVVGPLALISVYTSYRALFIEAS